MRADVVAVVVALPLVEHRELLVGDEEGVAVDVLARMRRDAEVGDVNGRPLAGRRVDVELVAGDGLAVVHRDVPAAAVVAQAARDPALLGGQGSVAEHELAPHRVVRTRRASRAIIAVEATTGISAVRSEVAPASRPTTGGPSTNAL